MTRTKRSALTFSHAFTLEGGERSFPAGVYEVVTDEELIEGLSFPAYRFNPVNGITRDRQ